MWLLSSTGAWVAAVTVAILIVFAIPGVRDVFSTGEGRIFYRGTTYCFVQGVDESHCQQGDEILRDNQYDDYYVYDQGRPLELHPSVPPVPAFSPPLPPRPPFPDR